MSIILLWPIVLCGSMDFFLRSKRMAMPPSFADKVDMFHTITLAARRNQSNPLNATSTPAPHRTAPRGAILSRAVAMRSHLPMEGLVKQAMQV